MPRTETAKKRARKRGEGSLRQRTVGGRIFWEARLPASKSSRRVRESFYGKTIEEAVAKRNAYLVEAGKPVPPDEPLPATSVADFAQVFLENRKRNKRPATYESYETTLRVHVLPHIGSRKMATLRDTDVTRLYRQLEDSVSPSMRKRVHTALRAMLNYAVERKAIAVSPLATIKQDVPRYKPPAVHPLTESQVASLLKASRKDRQEALIVLALDSGARQGELFGLHWDDVNLAKGEVYIHQAASETADGVTIQEPKTPHSRRNLPITPETVKALRNRKAIAAREGLADCPLVFPSERGHVLRKANFLRDTWNPIRKAAGIPTARFHDLRHTTATMLLKANVHPKVVQERLGHFSVALTLDTYSAFIPSMQAGAAKALSGILGRLQRSRPRRSRGPSSGV
jgi:integrase